MSNDSSIGWETLRVLADSSARSVLLALLVGLALRLGRVRNVAARHAAWVAVLCAMLGLPLLTASLPGITIPLMPASAMRSEPAVRSAERRDARPAAHPSSVVNAESPVAVPHPHGRSATPGLPRKATEPPLPSAAAFWSSWILAVYLIGASLMLGRLALGFALCHRMIRSSNLPGLPVEHVCSPELQDRLHRVAVILGTSPATAVPLTVGWLRPRILLPDGWRAWSTAKRDAALAHELAHVERRDTLITLVGAINLCVYWFHPLAWLLRRRLASLAEHACDDLAITWTGQRAQYARHLLEFARSMAGHRALLGTGGLSMADGGDLRSRIGAILDQHRPAARPLGRRQIAAFAFALALIVPLLAAIQVQRRASAAPPAVPELPTAQATDKREKEARESRELHGRVLDPDGRPFAGAMLYVPFEDSRGDAFVSKGRSGPDGRFRIRLTREDFKDCAYDALSRITLAATADGFGLGWVDIRDRDGGAATDADLTLRLVKDIPIEGRLLTLEGKPVAGARIKVDFIQALPGEDMTEYLRGVRNGAESHDGKRFWAQPLPTRTDPILTDGEGRFRLAGAGRERLIRFAVEGPGIQSWHVFAATRQPANARERVLAPRSNGSDIYPATFEHMVNPSRPIRGIVREKETGRPVVGARISSDQGQTLAEATTDAQGRFALLGYPKSSEYTLTATPAEGQPLFAMYRKVSDTAGLEPIQIDFELIRGIVIRGHVIDGVTGTPVKGEVEYYPLSTNSRAEILGEVRYFQPPSRSVTDANGNYAVVALPGPGTLAVAAWEGRWDRYLAARIDRQELKRIAPAAPDSSLNQFAPVEVGGPLSLSNYNELKLISPTASAGQPIQQDIALRVGRTVKGHVVGPDGKTRAGVRILGGLSHQFDEIKSNSAGEFSIKALDPEKKRPLNFLDADRKLGFYTEIRGDQSGPFAVLLQTCGAASGRIVDDNGQPLRNHAVVIHRVGYIGADDQASRTDDEGRFRFEGLVPGQPYQVDNPGGQRSLHESFKVSPGETRDLGDARIQR